MARTYQVYGGGFSIPSGFGRGTFDPKTGRLNVRVVDTSMPLLKSFKEHLASDVRRAAHSTAFQLHMAIKNAIRSGSADSILIPNRKVLDSEGRRRLRKQFKAKKIKNGERILAYMLRSSRRFMGGGPGAMAQKNLMRAVNYMKLSTGAIIGWGSKSSPYWGNAVQEGKQGTPFKMEHTEKQSVTSAKQKKFLRAIGMMPKSGIISQPKAAFFAPFIRGRASWINATMDKEIEKRIKQREAGIAKAVAS